MYSNFPFHLHSYIRVSAFSAQRLTLADYSSEADKPRAFFVGTLSLFTSIEPKSILYNSMKHLVNGLTYYTFKVLLNTQKRFPAGNTP